MRVLVVLLLAVLLVTFTVVTLHRQAPIMPPPKLITAPVHVLAPHRHAIQQLPLLAVRRGPIDISGPLKARAVTKQSLPAYPEWAEEDGVTGIVSYRIWVNPEGHLKSLIQMVRASGYPSLDDAALNALKEWEFAALPNTIGNQWGIVTFRFTLDNALPPREFISHAASLNPPESLHPVWQIH